MKNSREKNLTALQWGGIILTVAMVVVVLSMIISSDLKKLKRGNCLALKGASYCISIGAEYQDDTPQYIFFCNKKNSDPRLFDDVFKFKYLDSEIEECKNRG